MRKVAAVGGVVIGLCVAALLALWAKPPDLIRIGSNYTEAAGSAAGPAA